MKTISYISLTILVSLLVSLSGCTPTPMYRIEPFGAANSTVIDGRTVVKESKDSIEVVTSFVGTFQDYAVFDVEVFNNTNHDLMVSPKDFLLVPFTSNEEPYMDANLNHLGKWAVDPIEQMNKLDYQMTKEEKRIKTAKTFNTILAIAGAVTVVAAATQSTGHRDYTSARNTMALGETMLRTGLAKGAIDRSIYYSRMDQYSNAREVWRQQTFLRNVLPPKSSLRGDVFIPYNPSAPKMQMSFPVNQDSIIFWFEKVKVNTKR